MISCLTCRGSKKYAPMGGIKVICKSCNGTGLMQDTESKPIKVTLAASLTPALESALAENVVVNVAPQVKQVVESIEPEQEKVNALVAQKPVSGDDLLNAAPTAKRKVKASNKAANG